MEWFLTALSVAVAVGALVVLARQRHSFERRLAELMGEREEMMDAAVRESDVRREQLIESVFLALGDACLLVDSQLAVEFANERVREIFAQPPIPPGRKLEDVIADHRLIDLARRALAERRELAETFQVQVTTPKGKLRNLFLAANMAPVPDPGSSDSLFLRIIIRDITEQRETEQIRKDFVANASHELRTPLSIINGYLENLVDGVIDGPQSIGRALATMQKHGERIARIVDDMLTISKFESGEGMTTSELRSTVFDFRRCVEDVLGRLAPVIEANGATVVIDIPERARDLAGDRFYWDQVFFNLIENALKENPAGQLTVEVAVQTAPDGSRIITVKDDGVGIPRAALPFVFKRFYRVAKHHAKELKGTGLGLSIVKRAVEAHGGTIGLTSTPGVETCFRIQLPPPTNDPPAAAEEGVMT